MEISVVIPALNEEENIGILLSRLRGLYGSSFEIIVVDDGSTDSTSSIAKFFGVKVIENDRSSGKGFALRRGFAVARGKKIVMMDADLSHKPEDIPLLLAPLDDKFVGCVIASRSLGGSEEYTFFRAAGNIFISNFCNILLGTKLFDAINGFKAMRKEVTQNLTCKGFEIEIEILRNVLEKGFSIKEVPSQEKARAAGKGKSPALRTGYKFLKQIIIECLKLRLKQRL